MAGSYENAIERRKNELCAGCGFERREHTYNGACYGICGEFVENTSSQNVAGYTSDKPACDVPVSRA